MTTATKAPGRYLSGWCNLGSKKHSRCTGSYDDQACNCECHVEARLTPEGVLVTDAEPDTDAWFAARRGGITGTDLPKILGLSKYGNALSVWLDKRDELDDEAGEAALWGHLLEDTVAQEWARRNSATVDRVGVIRHEERAWQRASLDRTVRHGTCPDGGFDCGLEVKTRSAFKAGQWRDDVPDDVLAQTSWGLLVTGFDHMHVATLIGGQELLSFRVDRDEQLLDYLVKAAEPVWQAVVEGNPPDAHPDAEGVLLDLLNKVYGKRSGDRDLEPVGAQSLVDAYLDASARAKAAEGDKTVAKTALVQLLDDGDAGFINGRLVFTYRRPEPGTSMPAKQLRLLAANSPEIYEALEAEGYIATTNPGPRFDMKEKA